MDILDLPARALTEAIRQGEATPLEVLDTFLARIKAVEPKIHALLHVDEERARERAQALTKVELSPKASLLGIPIIVKDNICARGVKTTCASKILENFVAPYDATVVERLEGAGAILIAKSNMDEFAMGSSTENSAFGPSRNPWDTSRVPGGSSGGSAAAVAAGEAPLALGSDTGGSIRQPAALCGVSGMKPTYGAVSRFGLVAFASSLDQIGPFARNADDLGLLLSVIAGPDPRDATSSTNAPGDLTAGSPDALRGLRLGIPKEFFGDGLDGEVGALVEQAAVALERLGARRVPVSLPHTFAAVATYYIVATAEASSNLARYDGVHYGYRSPGSEDLAGLYSKSRGEGFGPEVRRRIMLGTYALSSGYYDAYYLKAMKVRARISQDFQAAFQDVDLILSPTAPTAAFKLGEKAADPLSMYLSDIYTISANLAGIPAVSVPCGFTRSNLPVGLQLMGPAWSDSKLLAAARAYQTVTDWHRKKPQL